MFLVLVIAGQLVMAVLVDHFGWLGMPQKPFTLFKAFGLLLILFGVVLLKK